MIVIDASVGIKWFLKKQEANRDIALEVQKNHLEGKGIIAVPELFFIEIANALLTKTGVPQEKLRMANEVLFDMHLRILPIDEKLLDLALYLGSARKITVYDALYVAMSVILSVPFITADEKLYSKTNDVHSLLLKDWGRKTFKLH